MYKRILVAMDGSHTSELALREAINLAKAIDAQLLLVHAVDEVGSTWYAGGYLDPSEIWAAMVKTGRDILEKAAAATAEAGLKTDTKLIEINIPGHRIPEVIAEQADAWPADLIVAGTHGRRGISHMFLGSVAEGIIRVSTKPVLLIRGE